MFWYISHCEEVHMLYFNPAVSAWYIIKQIRFSDMPVSEDVRNSLVLLDWFVNCWYITNYRHCRSSCSVELPLLLSPLHPPLLQPWVSLPQHSPPSSEQTVRWCHLSSRIIIGQQMLMFTNLENLGAPGCWVQPHHVLQHALAPADHLYDF